MLKDFDIMQFYNRLVRFLKIFPIGHLEVMSSEMYRVYYKFLLNSPYGKGYNDACKEALLYDKTVDFYSNLNKGIKNSSTEDDISRSDESKDQEITYFSPYETEILEKGKIALLKIDSFLYPTPFIRRYYSDWIMKYEVNKQEVNTFFSNKNAQDYNLLDIVIKKTDTYPVIHEKPLFCGRIWLLTSKNNFSASETFARFCKVTGFATLVGRSTSGSGDGGSPLFFPLPNSGIMVRFDADYVLNPDGTNQFESGTEPDYSVEGDPLNECLRIIKAEKLMEN